MKKNTLALILALTAVGAAQAGILNWAQGKVAQAQEVGRAAYNQYGEKVQQGLTKGQELYGQHGERLGGIVGQEKAGMVGQGLGAAQQGWTKAGGYLGKRADVAPAG
jgi:hypothetical protein